MSFTVAGSCPVSVLSLANWLLVAWYFSLILHIIPGWCVYKPVSRVNLPCHMKQIFIHCPMHDISATAVHTASLIPLSRNADNILLFFPCPCRFLFLVCINHTSLYLLLLPPAGVFLCCHGHRCSRSGNSVLSCHGLQWKDLYSISTV